MSKNHKENKTEIKAEQKEEKIFMTSESMLQIIASYDANYTMAEWITFCVNAHISIIKNSTDFKSNNQKARKVVQVVQMHPAGFPNFVLCEDGTLWRLEGTWSQLRLPPIPD